MTRLPGKASVTRIDDIVPPDNRLMPRGRGRKYEKLAKNLSYYALCRKWAASTDEYLGRAGWTLMAGQLEDNDPEALLDTIEKRMKAAPFRMQEPMNYCLVKIAVDYPQLRKRAIATSPFAPIWINYILEHRK